MSEWEQYQAKPLPEYFDSWPDTAQENTKETTMKFGEIKLEDIIGCEEGRKVAGAHGKGNNLIIIGITKHQPYGLSTTTYKLISHKKTIWSGVQLDIAVERYNEELK